MNALEFFAKVTEHMGHVYWGKETIIRLPYSDENDNTAFYHMFKGELGYFFEYLLLEPRDKAHEWFYIHLMMELEDLPYEKQYKIIQRMKTMEIEFKAPMSYDKENDSYRVSSATDEKYPLYSVRGTCNMEKKCEYEPICCKIHDEPCCFNKKVGVSKIDSAIKYPEYYEFLPELVIWMAVCPDLDALYVLHDDIPYSLYRDKLYYNLAFQLKDNKITFIGDETEIKRMYEEYHAKYPCDTSEVEDDINSWYGVVSEFHF